MYVKAVLVAERPGRESTGDAADTTAMQTHVAKPLNGIESGAKVESTMDTDTIFHLLQSERRRIVLELLAEHGEIHERDIETVAARKEFGERPSSKQRKRVKVSLNQTHLDKLEDHGVIEFVDGYVVLGPNAGPLLRHIEIEKTD